MKNIAVIFAGGVGQRMTNATKPKQFLEVNGKPILVYTMEKFQAQPAIDAIILVCVEDWIDYAKMLVRRYELTKVVAVIPGGSNGHQSRSIGLRKAKEMFGNAVVLVHDGVRPLIDGKTIDKCIESVHQNGNAIVASPAIETVAMREQDENCKIVPREKCAMLRAPQCFFLDEILELFDRAQADGYDDFIDCATMSQLYQKEIFTINGPAENIKITTPLDYFMFKGILEIQRNQEVFGI